MLIQLHREMVIEFSWVATPDGRHLILPRNAAREVVGEWQELAGHPSEYGDLWSVHAGQDLTDGFARGTLYLDPAALQQALVRLEVIGERLWRERLSRQTNH